MTREEKIKVLAEMDGWQFYGIKRPQILWILKNPQGETVASDEDPAVTFADFAHLVPNYLTSYDAIIPLVQKHGLRVLIKLTEQCSILDSPEELADALIKAVGKWIE